LATTAFVTSSPTFTGVPVAPTAAYNTNTTQLASTAFVQGEKVSPTFTGVPTAPTAAYNTNTTQLATTAFVQGEKVSPTFTGVPTAPTANIVVSNTQIATTRFVTDWTNAMPTMSQQNANAVAITGGSIFNITDLAVADGGTGASTAADARTNLQLGNIAVMNTSNIAFSGGTINNVAINGGNISGLNTPLPVASGGTGASIASDARNNIGLGSIATQNASLVAITGGTISGLGTPLPLASGGTGSSTAGGARTNLELASGATTTVGTMAVQNASSVAITGGSIAGITDLAVADGGTGASTAADARTNLGAAAAATTIIAGTGLTGGGSLATDRTLAIATNSNGYGVRYISTSGPSGGSNGDIWYQI
jgi:hypothetical protein